MGLCAHARARKPDWPPLPIPLPTVKHALPATFEADTWARLAGAVRAIHGKAPVNCSLEDLYRVSRKRERERARARAGVFNARARENQGARARPLNPHTHPAHTHSQDVEAMVLHGMADKLYDNLEVREGGRGAACFFSLSSPAPSPDDPTSSTSSPSLPSPPPPVAL